MRNTIIVLVAAGILATFGKAEAAGQGRRFEPNPMLAGLADNSAMNLGAFTWEKPAGEPPSGSVTDYSGMTYDPHNNRILLFGGGHATTWTDAIYAFSFSDLKWSALYSPTPARFYKKENMDRGFWKKGEAGNYPRPIGRHTYDLLVVPDDREELLLLMNGCGPSSVAPGFGYFGNATGCYDFKTGRWKIMPSAPFGSYGGVAEYDPPSKKVIGAAGQDVHAYDPADGKSVPILRNVADTYKVSGYSGTMVYFPPDRKMYCIPANKKVWTIELDRANLTSSKVAVLKVTGVCPASKCAFAYDARNRVIGGGVMDNRFYIFDPARLTWSSEEIQVAKPGTMTFHCLAYSPVDNVYVFIAGNRTWAYRWKR